MTSKRPASQQLSAPHIKRRETDNASPRSSGASSPAIVNAPPDTKICLDALLSVTASLAAAEIELGVFQSQFAQANADVTDAKSKKNFSSYVEVKQRYASQRLDDVSKCQAKVDILQEKKNLLSESFVASINASKPVEEDLFTRLTKRLTVDFEQKLDQQTCRHKKEMAHLQDNIDKLSSSNEASPLVAEVVTEVRQLRDDLKKFSGDHVWDHTTVTKTLKNDRLKVESLAEELQTLRKVFESYQPGLDSLDIVLEKLPERIMKVEANMRLALDDIDHHTEQLVILDGKKSAVPPAINPDVLSIQYNTSQELKEHMQSVNKRMEDMARQIDLSTDAVGILAGDANAIGICQRVDNIEAHLGALPDVSSLVETFNILKPEVVSLTKTVTALQPKVAALDSLEKECGEEFTKLDDQNKVFSARVTALGESLKDGTKPVIGDIKAVESRVDEHSKRLDTQASDIANLRTSKHGNQQTALFNERMRKIENTISYLGRTIEALPSQTLQASTDVVKKEEFEALQAEAKTIKRDAEYHSATFTAVQQAVQHLESRVNNTTTEHISSMLDRWLWDHGVKSLRNLFAPIKLLAEVENLLNENGNRVQDEKTLRAHVDNIEQRLKTSVENVKRQVEQSPQVDTNLKDLPQKHLQLSLVVDKLTLQLQRLPPLETETRRLGQQLTNTSGAVQASKELDDKVSGLTDKVEKALENSQETVEQLKKDLAQVREDIGTAQSNAEKRRADLDVTTDRIMHIDEEYKKVQDEIREVHERVQKELDQVKEELKKPDETLASFKDDLEARATNLEDQFEKIQSAQFRNASTENLGKLQKRVDELSKLNKSMETWSQLEPKRLQKVVTDVEDMKKWLDDAKKEQKAAADAAAVASSSGPSISASQLTNTRAVTRDQTDGGTPSSVRSASIARTTSSGNQNTPAPFLEKARPRQNTSSQAPGTKVSSRPSTPATAIGQSSNAVASSAKNSSSQGRIKHEVATQSSSSYDSGRGTPNSTTESAKAAKRQRRVEKRKSGLERKNNVELVDMTNMASDDDRNGEDPLSSTRRREATEEL